MDLFNPRAPWQRAASRIDVFKIYPQWITQASDHDLQVQFADLKRRDIAVALEFGILSESGQCGSTVEGYGGASLIEYARRIQRAGGNLKYVAMDEPIFFGTLYNGKNACRWTIEQMVLNAAVNIRSLLKEFPNIRIGDIEPLSVEAPNWLAQYRAGIEAFHKILGFRLAFLDADVRWEATHYKADLRSVRNLCRAEGVPFGVIYNGNASDGSDGRWIRSATRHMKDSELYIGTPDRVIFQSWHLYPKKLLPETDADSFTSLVDRYVRRR